MKPRFQILIGLSALLCAPVLFSAGCFQNTCEADAPCSCPRAIEGKVVCDEDGAFDFCDCSTEQPDGGSSSDGGACPATKDCIGRVCGADPVCGISCGVCSGGTSCNASGQCVDPCTDAYDCNPGELCSGSACVAYDDQAACSNNVECPQDHTCNTLSGACEGCLNDAGCINSPNGPACDVMDDGQGPGVGYCFVECTDVGDCTAPEVCDTSRGGLCVPGCASNADCNGGLACLSGICAACSQDADCTTPQVCGANKLCEQPKVCTDTDCQTNFGDEFYCDVGSNTCLRGCHATLNPCTNGTCNTATHQCEGGAGGGGGCDCTTLACDPLTETCDSVSCSCQTQGGGTCDLSTACQCTNGGTCTVDFLACFSGAVGTCN